MNERPIQAQAQRMTEQLLAVLSKQGWQNATFKALFRDETTPVSLSYEGDDGETYDGQDALAASRVDSQPALQALRQLVTNAYPDAQGIIIHFSPQGLMHFEVQRQEEGPESAADIIEGMALLMKEALPKGWTHAGYEIHVSDEGLDVQVEYTDTKGQTHNAYSHLEEFIDAFQTMTMLLLDFLEESEDPFSAVRIEFDPEGDWRIGFRRQ